MAHLHSEYLINAIAVRKIPFENCGYFCDGTRGGITKGDTCGGTNGATNASV